jgi:hypothetical protein
MATYPLNNSATQSETPAMDQPMNVTQASIPLLAGVGDEVDTLVLDIDYHIIEHFSKHLYSSPNKAIEELVCNGFDAWATEVRVYLPGRFTLNHVLVIDDGQSMDIGGLKTLWHIADSPKVGERIAIGPNGQQRRMIGKFGIGKLASYTVGSTITHVCRREGVYFAVEVDYADIMQGSGGNSTSSPKPVGIRKIEQQEATEFLKAHFAEFPQSLVEFLDRPHWTVAIIGRLKIDKFPRGRLRWVLGNGMPIRPDFRVLVDEEAVVPALARENPASWDMASSEIQHAITSFWKTEQKKQDLKGKVEFGMAKGLDPSNPDGETPFVKLPLLGRIWGTASLYEQSLVAGRPAETGRSHGFFVMVRGRLVNQDDEKLFLNEPSFSTFYKSQYVIHVDGLDEDLLADREHVKRDSPRAIELAIVQRALYTVTRTENDARESKAAEASRGGALLPTHSREFFRSPLGELLVRHAGDVTAADMSHFGLDRKPLGEDAPLVTLSKDASGFEVNSQHPYIRNLENELGSSKKAKQFLRVVDQLAVADALYIGHLYELGLTDDQAIAAAQWRDEFLRTLATMPIGDLAELAKNLEETSYQQGADFENAIASVLQAMGFHAERDGASGQKDGFLKAPCGPDGFTFTFEAKGSKNTIANDAAEVSAAASHRDAVGASHAVIVGRKFAGFEQPKATIKAAIIQECEAVGGVSIMATDALISLMKVVRKYGYPLDLLKDVLSTVESPVEKLARIAALNQPTSGFDWKTLLNDIWTWQGGQHHGDDVPALAIKQLNPVWSKMPREEFLRKLIALQALAPTLFIVNENQLTIVMRQMPEIAVEVIERALADA